VIEESRDWLIKLAGLTLICCCFFFFRMRKNIHIMNKLSNTKISFVFFLFNSFVGVYRLSRF
jgi:hypothetical protein